MATKTSSCASDTARTPLNNIFCNYDECVSNDFSLSNGGKDLQLFNSDIHDWNITFAETERIQISVSA